MKEKIPQEVRAILSEVKKCLKELYGKHLKGIVLYGSYARGDFTSGSDIDILLLLKDMKKPAQERKKYFKKIWELDLKYNTVISVIPFKKDDYEKRRMPLILNAKREGGYI